MRRAKTLLCSLAALLAAGSAQAEEKRFDASVFRPSAAPRDLVMVQKSEVIGNLSPVVGVYTSFGLNPLSLINQSTGSAIKAVTARLEFTPMVGIGFFNWVDVTLAVPLIAWQTGDNLRPLGTEGKVPAQAIGDMRLAARLTLPYFNRKDEVKSGFGMAVAGNLNLPTGSPAAFTGDGAITGGPVLIADYRFGFGMLIAANGGVWLRPDRQFAGVRIGNMGSFGLAIEAYILQKYGISIMGEVYGYPSLTKFPDSPSQVPAEVLLGARWQGGHGISVTVGGSFGAACGFGAPALQFWTSVTFQPEKSREQDEIERLKQRDEEDPDHDGLVGDADRCPKAAGPPENKGCPDTDTDGDGVIDREDECPDLPAGPHGKRGCPTVYIKGDEIVILDQVHFATDKDIILDDSKPILEEVTKVFLQHPEIREVRIEGHTDVRASDAYNMNLSQRRVNSVMAYLVVTGVDAGRLTAVGYGHTQTLYDDAGCLGPDEQLSQNCRFMTSKNRRVVFRIVRRGAPPPRAITGADNSASVLPTRSGVLQNQKDGGVLSNAGSVLPSHGALPSAGVLPQAGENKGLPQHNTALPGKGVLPRQGTSTPKKEEAPPAEVKKPEAKKPEPPPEPKKPEVKKPEPKKPDPKKPEAKKPPEDKPAEDKPPEPGKPLFR